VAGSAIRGRGCPRQSFRVCLQEIVRAVAGVASVLNTDSDLMANIYIVLNYRRKLGEHAYGYYGIELKLAFSSL
jgi:hypothetical protein